MIRPVLNNPLESIVAYSPQESGIYLGSPSIAKLSGGELVVSHDFFGPNCPKDNNNRPDTTRIYLSNNGEHTWQFAAEIKGQYWSFIFFYKGALYLLGTSAEYGDIVIRYSTDKGCSWSQPEDKNTGLLFKGYYHCAPTPIVEHQNRLWRAFEDNPSLIWGSGFLSLVISTPKDADLLNASSWQKTNELPYDPERDPKDFGCDDKMGWFEGNIVAAPDGELYNILRVNSMPVSNRAAMAKVWDAAILSFDPKSGFIQFPGGMSKFTIRFDEKSRRYWSLTNEVFNRKNPEQRNILALISSYDLINWKRHCVVLYAWEDENLIGLQCKIGFQYVDWLFDDEDIVFVSRTAYKDAHSFHDANYITFHRLRNFRKL